MKTWQKRAAVCGAGVALLAGLGAGVAVAAIPDSSGAIHACYKTPLPVHGNPLVVIDSENGGSCANGYASLTWPAVKPVLVTTVVTALAPAPFPGGTTATATCPAGTVVTGGGYNAGAAAGTAVGESFPDGNGWTAVMTGGPSGPTLAVYAVCGSVG